MSLMKNGKFRTFGEIAKAAEDPSKLSLEWRIQDFSSLIDSTRSGILDGCCFSPRFEFCGGLWSFSVWPSFTHKRKQKKTATKEGKRQKTASEWVILRLTRNEGVPPHLGRTPDDELPPKTFNFSVGIKGTRGVEMMQKTQKEFGGFWACQDWEDFCLTSELVEQESRLMPNNVLTITCDIKRVVPGTDGVHVLTILEDIPPRSVERCLQVSQEIPLDIDALSSDFSNLKVDGILPDFELKCGDQSFRVHRSVLSAESEVFQKRMQESNAGYVDINDLEVSILQLLLNFIYSGKLEKVTEDAAIGLYVAAHQYAVPSLKAACSYWIKKELTEENCISVVHKPLRPVLPNNHFILHVTSKP